MRGEKLGVFFPCRFSDIPVGRRKIFLNPVQITFFSLKGNFARGHNALITVYELVFFLHELNIFFRETIHAQLDIFQEKFPVFLIDFRFEGAVQKRETERLHIRHGFGILRIEILVLFFVKFVRSIHRMSNARYRIHCGNMRGIFLLFPHADLYFLVRFCVSYPFVQSGIKRFQCVEIGPLVFELAESAEIFHGCLLFPIKRLNRN